MSERERRNEVLTSDIARDRTSQEGLQEIDNDVDISSIIPVGFREYIENDVSIMSTTREFPWPPLPKHSLGEKLIEVRKRKTEQRKAIGVEFVKIFEWLNTARRPSGIPVRKTNNGYRLNIDLITNSLDEEIEYVKEKRETLASNDHQYRSYFNRYIDTLSRAKDRTEVYPSEEILTLKEHLFLEIPGKTYYNIIKGNNKYIFRLYLPEKVINEFNNSNEEFPLIIKADTNSIKRPKAMVHRVPFEGLKRLDTYSDYSHYAKELTKDDLFIIGPNEEYITTTEILERDMSPDVRFSGVYDSFILGSRDTHISFGSVKRIISSKKNKEEFDEIVRTLGAEDNGVISLTEAFTTHKELFIVEVSDPRPFSFWNKPEVNMLINRASREGQEEGILGMIGEKVEDVPRLIQALSSNGLTNRKMKTRLVYY